MTTKTELEEQVRRAHSLFERGSYEAALQEYKDATLINSSEPVNWSNLATCYGKMGQFENMAVAARASINADVSFAKGYFQLATAQMKLNQLAESMATLEVGQSIGSSRVDGDGSKTQGSEQGHASYSAEPVPFEELLGVLARDRVDENSETDVTANSVSVSNLNGTPTKCVVTADMAQSLNHTNFDTDNYGPDLDEGRRSVSDTWDVRSCVARSDATTGKEQVKAVDAIHYNYVSGAAGARSNGNREFVSRNQAFGTAPMDIEVDAIREGEPTHKDSGSVPMDVEMNETSESAVGIGLPDSEDTSPAHRGHYQDEASFRYPEILERGKELNFEPTNRSSRVSTGQPLEQDRSDALDVGHGLEVLKMKVDKGLKSGQSRCSFRPLHVMAGVSDNDPKVSLPCHLLQTTLLNLKRELEASRESIAQGGQGVPEMPSIRRYLDHLQNPDLSFMSDDSKERFVNEVSSLRRLLEGQSYVNKANLILDCLSAMFHLAFPVDLFKLLEMLEAIHTTGDSIKDKDIVLLLGASGSGKTTTLLYLAGTEFEHVDDIDGFEHLSPVHFPTKKLEDFKVSESTVSTTQCLQSFSISMGEEIVHFCDSPGFFDTSGVETDLAHAFGTVRAIQRARSVKPVLVLEYDGGKFHTSMQVLSTVKTLVRSSGTIDFSPFEYIFTKCPNSSKSKSIWKQFNRKRKELSEKEALDSTLVALLDDIINKARPDAHVAFPLNGDPQELLSALCRHKGRRTDAPESYFVPFVSEQNRTALQLQLHRSVDFCKAALLHGDVPAAVTYLKLLFSLSRVLGEANDSFQQAQQAVKVVVMNSVERVHAAVGLFESDLPRGFEGKVLAVKQAMEEAQDLESKLSLVAVPEEPNVAKICAHAASKLAFFVGRRISNAKASIGNLDWLVDNHGTLFLTTVQLALLDRVFQGTPWTAPFQEALSGVIDLQVTAVGQLLAGIGPEPDLKQIELLERRFCLVVFFVSGFQEHLPKFVREQVSEHQATLEEIRRQIRDRLCDAHNFGSYEWIPSPKSSISAFLEVNLSPVYEARELLWSMVKSSHLCRQVLPDKQDAPKDVEDSANVVDAGVREFVERLVNRLVDSVTRAQAALAQDDADLAKAVEETNLFLKFIDLALGIVASVRGWSNKFVQSTDECWTLLLRTEASLKEQKSRIEERLRQSIDELTVANTKAEDIIRRLYSGKETSGKILAELVESRAWEGWVTLVKNEETMLSGFKRMIGIQSSHTLANNLGDLMTKLHRQFSAHLKAAIAKLASVAWHACTSNTVPALLSSRIPEMTFFFCFLRLSDVGSDLTETMFRSLDTLQCQLPTIQASLAEGFKILSVTPNELLRVMDFEASAALLNLLKSSPVLRAARVFADARSPTSPFKGDESRQELRDQILRCPDYDAVRNNTRAALLKVGSLLQGISFDNIASAPNEHDRIHYCNIVAGALAAAPGAKRLSSHFPPEELDLSGLHVEAQKRVVEETEKVGRNIQRLLSTFPDRDCDFPFLGTSTACLQSIAKVFRDTEPNVATTADRLRGEASRVLATQITETLRRTGSTGKVIEELTRDLVRLKKASRELSCFREEINKRINSCLDEAVNQSGDDAGKLLSRLVTALKTWNGDDAAIAQQILSEHKCFSFADNAWRNEITARHGIEYVLRKCGLSESEAGGRLKVMYGSFRAEYDSLVNQGIREVQCQGEPKQYLERLASSVKEIASDFTIGYAEQISELTATIFAYWTLENIDNSVLVTEGEGSLSKFLKQPHAPQVVATWTLLGCENHESQKLQNHLAQVRTGEGKSIILGVCAIILALLDYDVSCVCYSSYLSNRDFADFENMFREFGVIDRVNYGTLDEQCERVLNQQNGDIRELARGAFLSRSESNHATRFVPQLSRKGGSLRVLLIDEVDVFFKPDFFGRVYRPATDLEGAEASALIRYVWKYHKSLSENQLARTREARAYAVLLAQDLQPLFQRHLSQMLEDAIKVGNGNARQYVVSGDRICYKNMDGLTSDTYYGMETTFAYLKEWENGAITESTIAKELKMTHACGAVSYAELPVSFDFILGVTGTLEGLSKNEVEILNNVYDVHRHTYIPSAYGDNLLKFAQDSDEDIKLCYPDNFFLEIQNEIVRRRRDSSDKRVKRPVMVFFESKEKLFAFYNELEDGKRREWQVHTVAEDSSPSDKKHYFQKATDQGVVTLMIREFGRGTDFKCYDQRVLDAGGAHVIQAFYSPDLAELIQIKGRTARQGAQGSFSMVLDAVQLERDLSVRPEEFDTMRKTRCYGTFLNDKREEQNRKSLAEVMKAVDKAEQDHYRTLACIDALQSSRRKHDVCRFLLELNGGEETGAFEGTRLKREFVRNRKNRIRERQAQEKNKRRSKRRWKALPAPEEKPSKTQTHYQVLGVPQNASSREILRSYRRLALKWHPDRCKDKDATETFQLVKEAQEVLLDESKRKAYDLSLSHAS